MSLRPHVDFHQGTVRLFGLSARFVEKALTDVPLVWDEREDCYRADAMHADAIRQGLEHSLAGRFDWRVGRDAGAAEFRSLAVNDLRQVTLRGDQQQAVKAFEDGGRRGLVVMPTGTGKTVVAIELMIRCQCSTLVVVPVRDLMYQWHAKILEATGIDAGLIGDGVHRVSPISVTTYDSAAIHMPRIGDRFQMIVFDEVHHLAGPWRSDAARMSIAAIRLGLTATLPGDDQRTERLQQLVGPTLYQQSIAEASGKSLADYSVHRIAVRLTDDEQQRYRDYSRQIQTFVYQQREFDPQFKWDDTYALSAATKQEPDRARDAVIAMRAFRLKRQIEEHADAKLRMLEDLFRLHCDESVIVFTGSNVMARKISTRFLVPCLLSHCGKKERRQWLQGFAEGRYRVLVANRVLDEGVDLPEVKTAIVLGGLSSQRQAVQRLGRVLRKGTGGRRAKLYEVVVEDTREVTRSRDRRRNEAYRQKR
ncbi:excinuclease ABC subunit B [Stieleria maiorica]|uniref:Excinuclease ABC subunit B n=1 Tax=Stieleria maiorica TaxID=2795974 RepID=A0A5B9MIY6_9BACT|nr:DEAD/DEAH box helicase [Stieleria maiorica]QEG00410.1 excinuclease ABC subunit B [Stieleria maiorica]